MVCVKLGEWLTDCTIAFCRHLSHHVVWAQPFKVNHSLPSLPASVTQAQPVRPSSLDIPYLREQED